MDDVVVHPDIEPGVIDNDTLIKCVLEQGPKGEAGRLFAEEGVHLNEVKVLRLEFLNILRIDHLWMMTSLTKLSISHNNIEKIENLHQLTSLVELDLSFNKIEIIENLESLANVEVLTLYHNRISKIENLEMLEKLMIFSIGDNLIEDYTQVLYLRQFRYLRSLSFKGNPCYENELCEPFLKAVLPRVTYLNFVKVEDNEREASAMHFKILMAALLEEDKVKELKISKEVTQKKLESVHEMAYVEYLAGTELFESMFEKDDDGITMMKAGGDLLTYKDEYCQQYTEAMTELIHFGLEQFTVRQKEIEEFEAVLNAARDGCAERSKKFIKHFHSNKQPVFEEMKMIEYEVSSKLATLEDVESVLNELSGNMEEKLKDLWSKLMKEEMTLFEQCEDMRVQFAVNITELVNKLIEFARNIFGMWRDHEGMWGLKLTETLQTHLGDKEFFDSAPRDLQELLADRDILINAVAQSADNHSRFINDREDLLINRITSWKDKLIEDTNRQETERDRGRVLEIHHYVENERREWQELIMQLAEQPDPSLTALLDGGIF